MPGKSVRPAYRHGNPQNIVNHGDRDVEAVVILPVFTPVVVVDMLFNHRSAMVIPMTIGGRRPVTGLVRVLFALFPAIVMAGRRFIALMVALFIFVSFIALILSRPCIAPQCQ